MRIRIVKLMSHLKYQKCGALISDKKKEFKNAQISRGQKKAIFLIFFLDINLNLIKEGKFEKIK